MPLGSAFREAEQYFPSGQTPAEATFTPRVKGRGQVWDQNAAVSARARGNVPDRGVGPKVFQALDLNLEHFPKSIPTQQILFLSSFLCSSLNLV